MSSKLFGSSPVLGTAIALIPLLAIFASSATVSLSGTIINQDSTRKAGVLISLAGTNLSATSEADGTWSLTGESTTSIARNSPMTTRPSVRLAIVNNRIRFLLGRNDVLGQANTVPYPTLQDVQKTDIMQSAFRTLANTYFGAPDTLVYSWNGKVMFRDTLYSLSHNNIVRYFDTSLNTAITYDYFVDSRDSRIYRIVKIAEQFWMTQNLNFSTPGSVFTPLSQGRRYTWVNAMMIPDTCATRVCLYPPPHQGICPLGWHNPSLDELTTLSRSAGNGAALYARIEWPIDSLNPQGLDPFGFHALPDWIGSAGEADYWSSTGYGSDAWDVVAARFRSSGFYTDGFEKSSSFSVRCIRD